MSKGSTFVGMDVHRQSIDLTVAEGGHEDTETSLHGIE